MNDDAPQVTVIVRTKDRPALLLESLESVAAQRDVSLEAIVVNDGGEPVGQVVASLAGRVSLRVVELQPGRGRSAAANAGVAAARGRWIGFLDDDDLLAPTALRDLLAAAEGHEAVPYGRIEAFLSDSAGQRRPYRSFGQPFDATALLYENFIPIHACLIPTRVLRAIGGLDEELEVFEDWDLFLRLADRLPFLFVPVLVGEYRLFGNSFVAGGGGPERQRRGRLAVLRKHRDRYDPHVVASIRRLVEGRMSDRLRGPEVDDAAGKLAHLIGAVTLLRREADLEGAPLVSVIIPNYNGRDHLERCLPALARTAHVTFETIVVDNGSTDGSAAWLAEKWPSVRVLELGANLGFGEATGRGVNAARGEFVAFLNNDTEVEPEWLEGLLLPLEAETDVAASCATLHLMNRDALLNARGGGMTSLGYGFDIDFMVPAARPPLGGRAGAPWHDVLFPTCAAALMRKARFQSCGGFDRAFFMYHEDVDLGWRLWLLGQRVVVSHDAVVHHSWGGTSHSAKGLRWREVLGMRHNLRSLLKHYEFINLLRAAKGIARVWVRNRAVGQAAAVLAWNLFRLPDTLSERRRIQRRRRRRDAELVDAGLVSGARYPAPHPQPPAADAEAASSWLLAPTLLPGWPSGSARLGAGWFAPDRVEGERVRWSCGHGEAFLRVAPRATGVLTVSLRVGTRREGERVVVCCNGAEACAEPPIGSWHEVSARAQADESGVLHVTVSSPVWVPHYDMENWDFRVLGCAVREISFVADGLPRADQPTVTVIIPTFNRWETLNRTLEALATQSYRALQLIVVDDGSTDGTWDRLQAWADSNRNRLEVVTLRQANARQGQARNLGLAHARGDLVVFLGDDTIPAPRCIEEHVARHRELPPPCAVIGFTDWDREKMKVSPFLEFINREGAQFAFGLLQDGGDAPYTCFYTSNISIPRDALGDRPFDPAFTSYGWEDVELGYRLGRRGLRIVYHQAALARHFHPTAMAPFLARQRQVGRSVDALLALHPELAGDEFMPPQRPRTALLLAAPVMLALLPAWRAMDALGIALPGRIYRALLLAAYFRGRRDALRERSA
ncbi:MAG: glycosyltransferase family 2 protein [Acidobacteriota bacterium]